MSIYVREKPLELVRCFCFWKRDIQNKLKIGGVRDHKGGVLEDESSHKRMIQFLASFRCS